MGLIFYYLLMFQITLAFAESLQKLSTLQSIKLDGCPVTCSGLKAIGHWCISLREISLSKCLGVTDDGLSSLVTKHRDLRKLDITCCRKITHVSIAHITNSCTSLMSLRMESCSRVPKEAFVLIGQRCHFLEELDLTDNEIDDEGLPFCFLLSIVELLFLLFTYPICVTRSEVHFKMFQTLQLKTRNLPKHNG